MVGLSDADSAGMAPDETVSLAAGEADAADLGVALGIVRGAGVALGTSNRPRRCAAVGKGDADDTGVDVAAAVGAGVADIVADGNGVAVTDVDKAGVSAP